MADNKQDALAELADMSCVGRPDYGLYRTYYDGKQPSRLTDRLRMVLEHSGLRWVENFSKTIVDVRKRRLVVEGFSTSEEGAKKPVQDWARDLWADNRMAARQSVVHGGLPKLGDYYVIVDTDTDGAPRLTPNRPELIKPVYPDDSCDEAECVVKCWPTYSTVLNATVRRMNLYFADRVEKYFTYAKADENTSDHWMPYLDEGETEWPTKWVRSDGSPRGIPVFHFRWDGQDEPYGRSMMLSNIPFQDGLDKQLIDLFWVADMHGWRSPYITGTGADAVDLKVAPGEWLKLPEGFTVGQLDASDLGQINESVIAHLKRWAAATETSLNTLLPGMIPSGESLKSMDDGQTKSIESEQTPTGDRWADCLNMARLIANDYGAAGLNEDERIETLWESVEGRDELVEAQVADYWHGLGVSQHTLQERAGFDPELEAERRGEESQTAFDKGQLDGPPLGPRPVVDDTVPPVAR